MAMNDAPQDFVQFSHPGGHLVAKVVVPSIGQNEAPMIREQVVAKMAGIARGRSFVLDLSQVSLVSSMGLGTCVDLRNCAEKAGLQPTVYGMNRHLTDLFHLMRIERLFNILKTSHELDRVLAS